MKCLIKILIFTGVIFLLFSCKHNQAQATSDDSYQVSLSDISVDESLTLGDGSEFKKLVFTYPTTNVSGDEVTVSAMMLIPTSIYENPGDTKVDFMILSNHGTITKSGEEPSYDQNTEYLYHLIGSKNAIGVAADYIGFGASVDEPQAYAYGDVNAKTSLQALICARLWLENQGYTWEDKLVNVGFSQGGQTTMHVQKIVDTSDYYGSVVTITKTFAGGGCYNLITSFDEALSYYNPPVTAAVYWLGIATFNNLSNLGYEDSELFLNPDDVELLLSKTVKVSYFPTYEAWSESLTEDFLDSDGAIRTNIKTKLADLNCNFTPKSTTKIVMFSDIDDDVVPTQNSDDLYNYFNNNGYTMELAESADDADFSANRIYIKYDTSTSDTDVKHGTAGSAFFTGVISELASDNW